MSTALVNLRKQQCPSGWKVDSDAWFYRPARTGDGQRISTLSRNHRAFIDRNKTFSGEPDTCRLLDGASK